LFWWWIGPKTKREKASDGFEMHYEISNSNSDGVFDSQDAHFSDVRIWQDFNIRMAFRRQMNSKVSPNHNIVAIILIRHAATKF